MDTRIFRVFLMLAATLLPSTALLADDGDDELLIDPTIVRLGLHESNIARYDIEGGLFLGMMSVEDFGSHEVYGVRLAWHASEYLFLEGQYGTTRTGSTSAETLDPTLNPLSGVDRDLTYYNLSLGFNALQGEVFVGANRTYNTQWYVLLGAGTTEFADERLFTINAGAGVRVVLKDWLAVHLTCQDLMFEKIAALDPGDNNDITHNLQVTTSITAFF